MNITNNKTIIALFFLLIIVFIINRETFVTKKKKKITPKKIIKKIIPKKLKVFYKTIKDPKTGKTKKIKVKTTPIIDTDVKLTNITPVVQLTNIPPLPLQYTAGSLEPIIISSSNTAPSSTNVIPSSNEPINNYQPVPKNEISITKDILKPIGNIIVDTIKNPPGPNTDEPQKPKTEISITKDIVKPIVNLVTNEINQLTKQVTQTNEPPVTSLLPMSNVASVTQTNEPPVTQINEPSVTQTNVAPVSSLLPMSNVAPVTEPQPIMSNETDNLFLLQPIEVNNVAYYDANPNVFKNIDFVPDGDKYLNLSKISNEQYNFGLPSDFSLDDFYQDVNNTSIFKENNLTITGFNDENKDLIITGINQTNKI